MQITLNQDEITAAVEMFVRSQISIQKNQSISIDFTMGRTPNGLTASLDIRSAPVMEPNPMYRPAVRQPMVGRGVDNVVAEEESETEQEEAPEETPAETAQESASKEAPAKTAPTKVAKANLFKGGNDADALEEPDQDAQAEEASAPKRSLFSKAS